MKKFEKDLKQSFEYEKLRKKLKKVKRDFDKLSAKSFFDMQKITDFSVVDKIKTVKMTFRFFFEASFNKE